ncbi:MAG: hypothetical protein WCT24_01430 [Patescibacteria group bacterium]
MTQEMDLFMYQRPYNIDEIKKFYPEKAEKLLNDPVHRWRAETGIELIHEEPTKEEQRRIWENWNEMTDEMKKQSDEKSIEFFGKTNRAHHAELTNKNMKISAYIKEYTSGERINLSRVFSEVREYVDEVLKWNKQGMHEEAEDVFHFVQLWMYWRFGIDGEIWKISQHSVQKFMDRKALWQKLYRFVGLDEDISNFCGNNKKIEKVVAHLGKFGVSKGKAEEAFRTVIEKE